MEGKPCRSVARPANARLTRSTLHSPRKKPGPERTSPKLQDDFSHSLPVWGRGHDFAFGEARLAPGRDLSGASFQALAAARSKGAPPGAALDRHSARQVPLFPLLPSCGISLVKLELTISTFHAILPSGKAALLSARRFRFGGLARPFLDIKGKWGIGRQNPRFALRGGKRVPGIPRRNRPRPVFGPPKRILSAPVSEMSKGRYKSLTVAISCYKEQKI